MPELLQSVYISKHVFIFNIVVLNAVWLSFNLLIFNFYEELLEEWQFESKSDGCVREETYGFCYSKACSLLKFQQFFFSKY